MGNLVFNKNSVKLGNADYNEMTNKPAINGKTLTSTTTLKDLGLDTVFRYKGQVATYDDLPTTNLTVGDTYNVSDTGSNYTWNGTSWDNLDADIWATKEELEDKTEITIVDWEE